MGKIIIEIEHVKNYLGNQWVHKDINLNIHQGEIVAIIGGSGCGKTTLLRCILMLLKPTSGTIRIFDKDLHTLSDDASQELRKRWGVLFQHSALFSTMTVLDNILFPMREFTTLPESIMQKLALLKINMVGLDSDVANKFPAELSGGMQRRAAAARAIAMDPELLLLDEPTTGLDPKSAKQFDELILFLRDALKLTIVMISHDVRSLERVSDRIAFIGNGEILAVEPFKKLTENSHPLIQAYFKDF